MKLNMEFGQLVRSISVHKMNDRPTMPVIQFVHGKFAVTGKSVLGISDQFMLKPACSSEETS